MTAAIMSSNEQQRYKYGGGTFLIGVGIIFMLMLFGGYDEMTSGRTEFHLWSTKLPAIPHQVMVGFWWFCLLCAAMCIVVALLPSVSVIIDGNEISAQSLYTRKFTTVAFTDIRDVDVGNKTFSIHSRNGNKITINQGMMRKRDYKDVLATVQARSVRTV